MRDNEEEACKKIDFLVPVQSVNIDLMKKDIKHLPPQAVFFVVFPGRTCRMRPKETKFGRAEPQASVLLQRSSPSTFNI